MTDIVTTVDVSSDFHMTKHAEALKYIWQAMQEKEPNYRREALLSLIRTPVELGYSGGPTLGRSSVDLAP